MDKRKWKEAPLNEATDHELSLFLCSFDTGMSKAHYELGTVSRVIQESYVSKHELIGIYFDDMLKCCDTVEEVKDYIKELIEEWKDYE